MSNLLNLVQDEYISAETLSRKLSIYSAGYWKKPLAGTQAPSYIELDQKAIEIRASYFKARALERQHNLRSSEMFDQWKEGKLSGPVYTEWVTAYLNIWDKISGSR